MKQWRADEILGALCFCFGLPAALLFLAGMICWTGGHDWIWERSAWNAVFLTAYLFFTICLLLLVFGSEDQKQK